VNHEILATAIIGQMGFVLTDRLLFVRTMGHTGNADDMNFRRRPRKAWESTHQQRLRAQRKRRAEALGKIPASP
jgi:hypothetical protein